MTKSAAPRMNVKLLRKIQKHITEEPKRYTQDHFIISADTNGSDYVKGVSLDDEAPPCGTMACIAGWAVRLNGDDSRFDVENKARTLLGLNAEEANRLFSGVAITPSSAPIRLWSGTQWPLRFAKAYIAAKTQRGRARAAVNRISHFIKTKGAE